MSGQAGEMERAVPPKFGSFATREGAEKEGVIITPLEVQYRYLKWLFLKHIHTKQRSNSNGAFVAEPTG